MIPGGNLDFAFVYLGCLDSYGHMFGWMSDGYFEQLKRSDQALGRLLAALPEESSVLLQSDHGGHERNHGTDLRHIPAPVHQLTAKTFMNALFRHPPDTTATGADRHKIVQSTVIIDQ